MRALGLFLAVAAACSDGPGAGDAGSDAGRADDAARPDAGQPDAAAADAGADSAVERDAGVDAAPVDAARPCSNPCPLHPSEQPESCSDRWHTCRIAGCTTFCGDVSMSPRAEGADCLFAVDCDRGMQCLRVSDGIATCRRFCRLGHDEDCSGSLTCEDLASLTTAEDEAPVTLPSSTGICD